MERSATLIVPLILEINLDQLSNESLPDRRRLLSSRNLAETERLGLVRRRCCSGPAFGGGCNSLRTHQKLRNKNRASPRNRNAGKSPRLNSFPSLLKTGHCLIRRVA